MQETAPVEIVQLTKQDWQTYRQLRLEMLRVDPQAFGSSYEEALARPDHFWQSRLEEAAEGENSWILFARSGGGLVGMIGAFREPAEPGPDEDPEAEIVSVYVTPAARGRGISNLLMEAILTLLKEQGFRNVRLGVNASQTAAVGLYRRFGFTTYKTVRHPGGIGYRMEKDLEDWPAP